MEYRLNKYISSSGFCSRREADRHIAEGNVTVNGVCATLGMRIFPRQKVFVNGIRVEHDMEPVYIALNKPVGIVSTTDQRESGNVIDFISHEYRIFPIGRLDKDSQGLLLLTNDGDIVNKILRAGNEHEKEYIVTVNRPIDAEFIDGMANGVPILDRVTRKCKLEKINDFTFKMIMTQGLNRQIRRMCEYFNYEVTRLERVKVLNIELGKIGLGNWRDLTHQELDTLFDMLEASEKTDSGAGKAKNPRIAKHATGFSAKSRREAAQSQLRASGARVGKQRPEKIASFKKKKR